MPKKTPSKKAEAKETKPEKATPEAEAAHAANPVHNHGPSTAKPPAFGFNRGGGAKPPRPPMPRQIVRGANRGR
jgi:hypothetical protein